MHAVMPMFCVRRSSASNTRALAAGEVDMRPVGLDEARLIFREYYLEKYGAMEGLHRMSLDSRRQRHRVLKPATFESHLYRPRRDAKGKLLVSGPERYDFEGVDDGSAPFPVRRQNHSGTMTLFRSDARQIISFIILTVSE